MNKMYRFLLPMVILIVIQVALTGCNIDEQYLNPGISPMKGFDEENEENKANTQTITNATPDMEDQENGMPSKMEGSVTEPILDESKYLVDGIFYPKEYAIQLGYIIYDSVEAEDHFSITRNGINYFIVTSWDFCGLFYEKDGKCHSVCIYDRIAPKPMPDKQIATGGCIELNSENFLRNELDFIKIIATEEHFDPTTWDMYGTTLEVKTFNCTAEFYSDGFINPWKFQNEDESKRFTKAYNTDQ